MVSSSEVPAGVNPSLRDATRVWWKIGILSFGGPAAQIALMHKEVVEERKWLSEQQFLNALSFCMLLPGPEAMQLATYAGWRLHGTLGGLIAGLLFVILGACRNLQRLWKCASGGSTVLRNQSCGFGDCCRGALARREESSLAKIALDDRGFRLHRDILILHSLSPDRIDGRSFWLVARDYGR